MTILRKFLTLFYIITSCSTVIITASSNTTKSTSSLVKRVINGVNVPPHSFQWAASLRGIIPETNEAILCGASFITNQWLITAAHCFSEKANNDETMDNPNYWEIRAGSVFHRVTAEDVKNVKHKIHRLDTAAHKVGSNNILNILGSLFNGKVENIHSTTKDKTIKGVAEGIVAYPDRIVIHPFFEVGKLEWDIALIHLGRPLTVEERSSIDTIAMPPKRTSPEYDGPIPTPGEECAFIGWGCKRIDGKPAQRAQMARLVVINHETCDLIFKYSAGINRFHEFCAGYFKSNIGICQGDSGSGLACNRDGRWYLAGVASATHAKKPSRYPGLFTRVSYFDDWIDSVINR